MKIFGFIVLFFVLILMTLWGALAIYYSYLPIPMRLICTVSFVGISCALLIFLRPLKRSVLIFLCLFGTVLMMWLSTEASNDRNWQPDAVKLPYAEIKNNQVSVFNVRNYDYRTESDYTIRHENRVYDLSGLRSFDLFLSDWGLKTIVHTIVSFGFEDGRYLCISIETRKEIGEKYSSLKGFFKQYELYYVVADERDLIRLRTNYRKGETVYLYRLQGVSPGLIKQVFLDYLNYINQLTEKPEWYNALTGNCTTEIRGHTRPYARKVRWNWRILANGYIDELIYQQGVLDTSLPFEQLKKKSIINVKAQAADNDPDFSHLIRTGLPGMNTDKRRPAAGNINH